MRKPLEIYEIIVYAFLRYPISVSVACSSRKPVPLLEVTDKLVTTARIWTLRHGIPTHHKEVLVEFR